MEPKADGCTDEELGAIISKLWAVEDGPVNKRASLSIIELTKLCKRATETLLEDAVFLELEGPITICGDIQGHFLDLLNIFRRCGLLEDGNGTSHERRKYLFLGNYVNRGERGIETFALLLAYKIKYPDRLFLLRGNFDCAALSRVYGFYDECKRFYHVRLWKRFCDCMNVLPFAALVDQKIFCAHGGPSPELTSLGQIRSIPRPIDIPDSGLLCDLLWRQLDPETSGWGENRCGVSYTYDFRLLGEFLDRFELDLLCSSRLQEKGYEFLPRRRYLSVFSAPRYGGIYENSGAVANVDENSVISITNFTAYSLQRKTKRDRLQKLTIPN